MQLESPTHVAGPQDRLGTAADVLDGLPQKLRIGVLRDGADHLDDHREQPSPWLAMRLRRAEEVQQAVEGRVKPDTWKAFWFYHVEMREMVDVARESGISIAAGHKACQRVLKMLRDEGRRRLDATTEEAPAA